MHRQLSECPYIAKLFHFFEDEQNVYLLMEHCVAQELYQFVKQEMQTAKARQDRRFLSEAEVAEFVR